MSLANEDWKTNTTKIFVSWNLNNSEHQTAIRQKKVNFVPIFQLYFVVA